MAAQRTYADCEAPLVSVVIPAFNAEPFLRFAIRSALAQTIEQVEVIVVDDGSTDSTDAIVEKEAALDGRVRLHRLEVNSGASAARRYGFAVARGQWIAVMDSDDLMSPDRLDRLVQEGDRQGADIVADNLARFSSATGALTLVLAQQENFSIDAEHYLRRNRFFRNSLHYGLLQPIFRTDSLRQSGQSYDSRLRIAEDDDFYLRLLLRGLRLRVLASTNYFYRQHDSSMSHIVKSEDVDLMTEASARLLADFPDHPLRDLLRRRHLSFEQASDYLRLVGALKKKDVLGAMRIAASRAASLPLLQTPLRKALGRLFLTAQQPADDAQLRHALHQAMRVAGEPLLGVAPSEPATPTQNEGPQGSASFG